jgi:cobalt/nickel transport system permease protein
MAGIHALIGIGEGLITTAALAFLLRVRKDLVHPPCLPRPAGEAV